MSKREIHVHFVPSLAPAGSLAGGVAVVIDLLRASTTITRAIGAGARSVVPVLEPEQAIELRRQLVARGESAPLLGGERGGVMIPGFDLDNSPARYAPDSVGGRTVVFTTTNGTRALIAASDAACALIGCFNNLSGVVERAAFRAASTGSEVGRVHLLCAGTRGEVSHEDVVCAGAMTGAFVDRGFTFPSDDQARIALAFWESARHSLLEVLRTSRGGRNLIRLGFDADIADCARIDTTTVVPERTPDGSLR